MTDAEKLAKIKDEWATNEMLSYQSAAWVMVEIEKLQKSRNQWEESTRQANGVIVDLEADIEQLKAEVIRVKGKLKTAVVQKIMLQCQIDKAEEVQG